MYNMQYPSPQIPQDVSVLKVPKMEDDRGLDRVLHNVTNWSYNSLYK